MLLAHAIALTEARSYVAALADAAHTFDTSSAYERILLDLDALHGGAVPPLTEVRTGNTEILRAVAEAAVEDLADQGIDALRIELLLAKLADARALDRP